MVIVSDTSPLINLAIIGQLDLIPKLFHRVILPQAVYVEIVADGASLPGAEEIKQAEWIEIKSCKNRVLIDTLLEELDPGESEAIALALEIGADLILMDEALGRKMALQYKLRPLGILGILLKAKDQKLIPNIKPFMDALIQNAGFYIHSTLYEEVLQRARE